MLDRRVQLRRMVKTMDEFLDTLDQLRMAQGIAKEASEEDMEKDSSGFTNPNLHRRIDAKYPVVGDDASKNELYARRYELLVQNVNSFRTSESYLHIDYQHLETRESLEEYMGVSLSDDEYEQIVEHASSSELENVP